MGPRITTATLARAKRERRKIAWITAYDALHARLAEEAGIEGLLVGDSVGTTRLGFPDTIPVSLSEMIHHAKAVVRGRKNAFVVVDLPFGSYQQSKEQAFEAAARVLKQTGADAIKLEGGRVMAETIAFLSARGVPVVGHIGLLPQSTRRLGSLAQRGRSQEEAEALLADARALDEAGAVALVLEHIPSALAAEITRSISIPTIGIGAGPDCDGQVLVWDDLLGLSPRRPPFAKAYLELAPMIVDALARYRSEVEQGRFPEAGR